METAVDGVACGSTWYFSVEARGRVFGILKRRKNKQFLRRSFGLGADKQAEIHRSAKEGGAGVVEGVQMVLTEPVEEKPVGAVDVELTVIPLHGLKGGEPGIESLLGHLLSDDPQYI
jgi:hypothetical protein